MASNESVTASWQGTAAALIGPTEPYRGGIAQYTTRLRKALADCCDLKTFSFKRLYPVWLYPGESDKEPGRDQYRLPDVEYTIDFYSPLSLRRTVDKIVAAGCEIAIISWWTLTWQPGLTYMARRLKRKGVTVIFLCHNLFDHDDKGLRRRLSESLLLQADAYITHSNDDKATIRRLKPDAPILHRIHPIYDQFPTPSRKLAKRGRLELLFFGLIRPYKGLDVLVRGLAQLRDEKVYLTVAGEAWGDVEALRQQLLAEGAPNLRLYLRYMDEQTAANFFARADVVVLPYRSATGSGVLAVAYNYRKPVLATNVGGLPDSVEEGRTGWLVKPDSPEELATAIARISREKARSMSLDIKNFCKENSWEKMAEAICEFAQSIKLQRKF